MAKSKRNKKATPDKTVGENIQVPVFTESRAVKRQVSVLAKLADWQRKSAETDWVIGEYLSG